MNIQSILFIILIFFVYLLGKDAINKIVNRVGTERSIALSRIHYVNTTINFIWTILALAAGSIITGIGYNDLGLFFGSALAILGVALFAQWSILSNVTASVIVFFFFPYQVGDYVQIIDGENTVQGQLKEITLFHVILISDDSNIITYPNTLVFQRAVKVTQRRQQEVSSKNMGGSDTE